jgi:predicted permease
MIRQLLTESLLLSALGGIAGFAAAWLITRVLPAALPAEAGIDTTYFQPDTRVVVFTTVLCLATTLLFGLVPALRAASPNLGGLLKGADDPARRRGRRGARVVVQAGMCVLRLGLASIFLRSLASSRNVDPGFRAEGVVDVNLDLGLLGKSGDRTATLLRILRAASEIPTVESATLAAVVPLSGSNMETRATPEGMVVQSRRDSPMVYFNIITSKFFATLRTPIVRGRELTDADVAAATKLAVINETAARRMFPNGDALGKHFNWGGADGDRYEIIGIARDANYVMPGEEPKPTVYLPIGPAERSDMTLQLRTSADLATIRRAVWAIVRQAAPALPPPPVVRMVDDMAITLLPVEGGAVLLGAFGAIALVLAAAGIYGVASYSVATRTREIGIRAALGATRVGIVRMVLWENSRRVVIGAVIGLLITIGLAAALGHVLYGVRAVDPVVLASVLAVVGVVALAATLGPAWRAARADPVTSMRES